MPPDDFTHSPRLPQNPSPAGTLTSIAPSRRRDRRWLSVVKTLLLLTALGYVGYKTAQEKKGEADAKATAVYAGAYGRDPEFYQFMKSLETLDNTVDANTTLILSTDSELLKYLKTTGEK